MINKELRNKILDKYNDKNESIFVASILDLANKFEETNHIMYTSFLNLYEKSIATYVLNMLKIPFKIFMSVKDIERTVIFLIPDYMNNTNLEDVYNDYICCLKITPPSTAKLMHKDYMGAIYNAGVKENMIGDIFINNNSGYIFVLKKLENYFLSNLLYVSKNEVKVQSLSPTCDEIKELQIKYKEMEIIIPSMRVDVILSNMFNLSRNEVKSKIEDGDLLINAKEMYFVAYEAKIDDIISFRKCGKFKIGKFIRNTKNGSIVISVYKYI